VAVELKLANSSLNTSEKCNSIRRSWTTPRAWKGKTPAIGILICKSKNRTIVEYALKESSQPIGVATYRIVTSVPEELRDDLPRPGQIAKLLSD
jgi:hypothetical protein